MKVSKPTAILLCNLNAAMHHIEHRAVHVHMLLIRATDKTVNVVYSVKNTIEGYRNG